MSKDYSPAFGTYFDVADEVYEPDTLTLDDLDPRYVTEAREWAERANAPWPPYLPWAEEALNDFRSGRPSPATTA